MEHIGGTFGSKESSDGRFIYHLDLPMLQTIASYRIARSIWHSHLSRWLHNRNRFKKKKLIFDCRIQRNSYGNSIPIQNIDKLIYSLKTPPRIEKMLKNSLHKVRNEFTQWSETLGHSCSSSCDREDHKIHFYNPEWCFWLPNGEIDYQKTAINALNSHQLNEVQKFLIMCQYCMEDEIKAIISTDFFPECFYDANFNNNPLLFYWICFVGKKLHEIPLGSFSSIAGSMAGSETCIYWEPMALEYFWSRMSPDDQRLIMISWIPQFGGCRKTSVLERLLSTMPWSQQIILLSTIPEQIIIKFGFDGNSPKPALWAWNLCKNTITEEQFKLMIKILLNYSRCDEEKMRMVNKIWDTAPEYLKNPQSGVELWKKTFCSNDWYRCGSPRPSAAAFEFLCKMIRRLGVDQRRSFNPHSESYDLALSLAQARYISDLGSLIDVFEELQLDTTERSKLQNSFPGTQKFEDYCTSLLNEGNFEKLHFTLDWFAAGDVLETRTFYKLLLSYPMNRRYFTKSWQRTCLVNDLNKWKKLCELFNFIYPGNSSSAYKMKLRFVSWMGFGCKFEPQFRNRIDQMIEIMNEAFPKKDLNRVKKSFFRSFGQKLKSETYWQQEYDCDEKFVEKFVKWCLNDDPEDIYEFRRNMAATVMYDGILNGLILDNFNVRATFVEILLSRLDMYLMWCLETEENVRKFKIRKMKRPNCNLEPFRILSREPDGHTLEVLLKWSFDGDKVAIRTFRSRRLKKLKKIPDKSIHWMYRYIWNDELI